MNALAHQLILRLEDDRVVAPSVAERRLLARSLLRAGRSFGLILSCAPDSHAHVLVRGSRDQAIECGRRMKLRLRQSLDLAVSFAWRELTPVRDQSHLVNTVHYLLRNARRHGVFVDPLMEATSLPDLLGLRTVGCYTAATVRELLPRVTRRDLLPHYGVEEIPAGKDLRLLREAAAASIGLPDLSGRHPETVAARIAAIRVARDLGADTREIARLIDVSESRVRHARHLAAAPALQHAIRLQMGLRERLAVGPTSSDGPSVSPYAPPPGQVEAAAVSR